jgi:hypothetical protein
MHQEKVAIEFLSEAFEHPLGSAATSDCGDVPGIELVREFVCLEKLAG